MEDEGEGEVVELRRKVQKLELEAENRHRMNEAHIAHREATLRSFAARCFGTAVAWVTSQTVFKIMLALADPNAHEGDLMELSHKDEFIMKCIYAIITCCMCPVAMFLLRPHGRMTEGTTFTSDFLKLVETTTPMVLMWSLMDVFVALARIVGERGWPDLVVMVLLTLVLAVLEYLPCYGAAKAAVDAGQDSLKHRYMVLPNFFVLTLGRLWHEFARWPIGLLQVQAAQYQNTATESRGILKFIVELFYSSVLCYFITWITAWWSKKALAFHKAPPPSHQKHLLTFLEHHSAELEMHAGQLAISALSFVYAWALSFLLQDFAFRLLFACSEKNKADCGSAQNFFYSVGLTVVNTVVTTNLEFQDRDTPWGKAQQTLTVLANSLCVGWAWKGYFEAFIKELRDDWKTNEVIAYIFLCWSLWMLAGNKWHGFLKDSRRRRRQRYRDFQKTKSEMLPDCDTEDATHV